MRGIEDSSTRAADAMGRDFDAAYRRMEAAANRVNQSRAAEEAAIARVQAAQQRAADAARRSSRIAEDAAERTTRAENDRAAALERVRRTQQQLTRDQQRAAAAAGQSAAEQARATERLTRSTAAHAAAEENLRRAQAARANADRDNAAETLRRTREQAAAVDALARAEQARADAEARRRDAESGFDRSRRDVIDIDTNLNDDDAIRGMTRLRMRLQAMANRPIRQDVEVVARGLAAVLKLAAGVTAAVTAIGGLGLAAGAAIIPVAALVASLSSMAGALLALPGIMAGLATILGTVVIGFTGLGDAIKQTIAAQEQSGAQAAANAKAQQQQARAVASAQKQVESARRGVVAADRQVEAATRQVTSAERTLASAHRASERAQQALTAAREDATRAMRDLNIEVAQGALDETTAVRELERARRDLTGLGSDATTDDREDAQTRVTQAELSLERIRNANADLAEEQAKTAREGIEGSEQVVAAREAVADATQGITDAEQGLADAQRGVIDAQQGVTDALAAVAEAQQAVTDAQNQSAETSNAAAQAADLAMSKLSGTGQELVNTLVALKPRWLDLRNTVQDALLVGVGASISYLVEQRLPQLSSGLAAVAAGVNTGIRGALAALSTDEAGSSIDTLLGNSAIAAADLGRAIGPAVLGLTNLFAIGSDYLPGLTQGLEGAGQAFLDWSRDGDAVRATIDRGIEVAQQWGEALSDVGTILGDIGSASLVGGDGPAGLMQLLDRLAQWTSSDAGQEALLSFFDAVRRALEAASPVLVTFLEGIGRLAPHAAGIVEAFAPFVDQVLTALVDGLDEIGPVLPDLAAAFGTVAAEMANLVPPLAEVAKVLLPPLADMLAFIAPILPLIIAGFVGFKIATVAASAIGAITTAVRLLGIAWATNPLGVAITVLAALVAAVIWAYNRFEWFRNVVDTVVAAIGNALLWMWENVWKPILGFIWTAIQWVGDKVLWWWNNITVPAFTAIGNIISWVWGNVISPVLGFLWNAIQWVGDKMVWFWIGVIVPVWNGLGNAIRWVVDNVVTPAFDLMKSGVQAVADGFTRAVDWIGQMWDRVKGIAARPARFVVETVYNNGIRAMWNKVAGWLGLAELPEVGLGSLGSYARGGVLPGHTPGRDIYRFVEPRSGLSVDLGGGEGILTTRTVDKLRAHGAPAGVRSIEALNAWGEGGRGGTGTGSGNGSSLGGYALGGVIDRRLWELVRSKFPGLQLTSALRPGDPGYHGRGQAVDVSNGYAPTPLMAQAANYFATAYGSQLAELIYGPRGGNNIKNGRPLNYGAATNRQHMNHVHLAATGVLGEPGAAPAEGDGLFGSVFGFMRNAVANAAESILSPIGERIPSFGDGLMGQVPRKAFDLMKDKVVGFLRGKADEKDAESGAELGGYGGNAQFYVSEIVRAVKSLAMDKLAAVIAVATALVESNLKMYANRSDPASLQYPYDAIGSDHDSSGLFQQRNNGAWGTIAERMNAFASAIMFLRKLRTFNYAAMDPGAAAQRVQVSAFPLKYAQRMAEARRLVDAVPFDSGGLAGGTGVMLKDVIRPERVLSPRQTEAFDRLVDALTLTGSGTVNIGGLNLSASGSVNLRHDGNENDRPGGGTTTTGRIDAQITIVARDAADAADQFADRLTALLD